MDYSQLSEQNNKPQDETPVITFIKNSVLTISGRSISSNPIHMFDELIKEIEEYKQQEPLLELVMDLEFFNTPSAKKLHNVFKTLEGTNTKVVWIYEEDDEDLLEAGQDFESMIKLDFEFRTKPVEK